MIKKLSKRICWIITIALSIIVVGIILLFTILNYRNTINTATIMMDRFTNRDIKKNVDGNKEIEVDKPTIEGVYYVQIEDSHVISNPNIVKDKTIEEYALKVSKKHNESGIIGNYIYKVRRIKENQINVMLIENEEAISHSQKIIITAIIISGVSLIIIYIIAKKISKFIVQPVEETFEKQKQFISDASHELKTPLAVIEANADVLEGEVGKNKWTDYIQNEIQSMDKLINELLLLTKIENVDNIQERKIFDVSKETEMTISMFESMAYERNVKLSSKIQENIMVNGNKEDIEHILSTLIDNAIKHTESGNEVIVELSKEKNELIIQVKNEGKEIPEKEREKIFERFYRIDKSRNRNEKRYGLGLAIAKSTVKKYNGNIKVLYKDGFTIFKVNLQIQ